MSRDFTGSELLTQESGIGATQRGHEAGEKMSASSWLLRYLRKKEVKNQKSSKYTYVLGTIR